MKKVILLLSLALLVIISCKFYISNKNRELIQGLTNENIIMHAMGEIDGLEYTNSLEAFERHYARGRRVFEVDFALTNDDKVVAIHSKKINMSQQEFLEGKIAKYYTTMSLEMIMDKMMEYQDLILVTDTKENFGEIIYEIVSQAKKRNEQILNRTIPQIYSKETYDACMETYKFPKVIYTLYRNNPKDREIVDFVEAKDNIFAVTMSKSRFSRKSAEKINNLGRSVLVHTLNEEGEINKYLSKGAGGIYTDSY